MGKGVGRYLSEEVKFQGTETHSNWLKLIVGLWQSAADVAVFLLKSSQCSPPHARDCLCKHPRALFWAQEPLGLCTGKIGSDRELMTQLWKQLSTNDRVYV